MPMQRTLDKDFFKVWSPDMAYVLGYFAADGSMIKNRRGGYFIEFTSTDEILIQQLRRTVGSTHCIAVRERGGNSASAYRIQFGSRQWYEDLTALGFSAHKSRTLVMPDVPAKYFGDFVRGYFDGDGCVYFGKTQHTDRAHMQRTLLTLFTSGSAPFLQELWRLLKEAGIRGGSLYTKERGFCLSFSRRDSLALYRLMYHTAPVSGLFLPRKRKKLERAVRVLGLDK